MAILIAPSSFVDRRAELGDDVEVGPHCVIGPEVRIGRGTRLLGHVCVLGATTIGERNTVHPFAVIGGNPQDVSYRGATTRVEIGDQNVIREGVTIHRATEKEQGVTRVGGHNLLMAAAHVAHDCKLGDRVVVGAGVMLGGHVHVESNARIAGKVAILQWTTAGTYSRVVLGSKVGRDVPPYMVADGNPARIRCPNVNGLRRDGFVAEKVDALRAAYRLLFRAKVGTARAEKVLRQHDQLTPEVEHLLEFIEAQCLGEHGRSRGPTAPPS